MLLFYVIVRFTIPDTKMTIAYFSYKSLTLAKQAYSKSVVSTPDIYTCLYSSTYCVQVCSLIRSQSESWLPQRLRWRSPCPKAVLSFPLRLDWLKQVHKCRRMSSQVLRIKAPQVKKRTQCDRFIDCGYVYKKCQL